MAEGSPAGPPPSAQSVQPSIDPPSRDLQLLQGPAPTAPSAQSPANPSPVSQANVVRLLFEALGACEGFYQARTASLEQEFERLAEVNSRLATRVYYLEGEREFLQDQLDLMQDCQSFQPPDKKPNKDADADAPNSEREILQVREQQLERLAEQLNTINAQYQAHLQLCRETHLNELMRLKDHVAQLSSTLATVRGSHERLQRQMQVIERSATFKNALSATSLPLLVPFLSPANMSGNTTDRGMASAARDASRKGNANLLGLEFLCDMRAEVQLLLAEARDLRKTDGEGSRLRRDGRRASMADLPTN